MMSEHVRRGKVAIVVVAEEVWVLVQCGQLDLVWWVGHANITLNLEKSNMIQILLTMTDEDVSSPLVEPWLTADICCTLSSVSGVDGSDERKCEVLFCGEGIFTCCRYSYCSF